MTDRPTMDANGKNNMSPLWEGDIMNTINPGKTFGENSGSED